METQLPGAGPCPSPSTPVRAVELDSALPLLDALPYPVRVIDADYGVR